MKIFEAAGDYVMLCIARFFVWAGSDEYRTKMKDLGFK